MATTPQVVRVNVAGELVEVDADPSKLLWNVMNQAFGLTGKLGEPWENWEFRDADGRLLDMNIPLHMFDSRGVLDRPLFLNQKAAIGG